MTEHPTGRLMPEEAYPPDMDAATRDVVDARLREMAHTVPIEPGIWLDREGVAWTLDPDGTWTDSRGETRPVSFNPAVAAFGPWSMLPVEQL